MSKMYYLNVLLH